MNDGMLIITPTLGTVLCKREHNIGSLGQTFISEYINKDAG